MSEMIVPITRLRLIASRKSPVSGIPRPGERPFATSRHILAGLLDGLGDSAVATLNGSLRMASADGRKAYTINDLNVDTHRYEHVSHPLRLWAESQRRAKERAKNKPAVAKGVRVPNYIMSEYRNAVKAAARTQPHSPYGWDSRGDWSELKPFEWLHPKPSRWEPTRDEVLRWYQTKPERKQFSRIQAACLNGLHPSNQQAKLRELYKVLKAAGRPVGLRFSKLIKGSRDKGVKFYVQHIGNFGGHGLSEWDPTLNTMREHNESLKRVRLCRERVAYLKSQIESYAVGGPIEIEL